MKSTCGRKVRNKEGEHLDSVAWKVRKDSSSTHCPSSLVKDLPSTIQPRERPAHFTGPLTLKSKLEFSGRAENKQTAMARPASLQGPQGVLPVLLPTRRNPVLKELNQHS